MWRRASLTLFRNGAHRVGSSGVIRPSPSYFCAAAGGGGGGRKDEEDDCDYKAVKSSGIYGETISYGEARKLMKLVNVEALKMKLGTDSKEVIEYKELLDACQSIGVAKSADEASAFARVLDEAGVVLLFRDKVYLHPDKVVDLVRKAVPLALLPEDDPCKTEMSQLQKKKEEIDRLAHKQVRCILWTGLGLSVVQVSLFFRLTFWEFSWDVMEPIAFFTTASGIVVGYAYFLMTSRDPTYQDFMQRLFLSRQRKLIKKFNFDIEKFTELQKKCRHPLDIPKHRIGLHTPDNFLHDD